MIVILQALNSRDLPTLEIFITGKNENSIIEENELILIFHCGLHFWIVDGFLAVFKNAPSRFHEMFHKNKRLLSLKSQISSGADLPRHENVNEIRRNLSGLH